MFTRFASLTLGAGLLSLALLSTASAQAMRVKAEAIVTTDTVRLDHLIDGIGKGGEIPVFRAPVPGARGTIRADRIVQAAREMGIFDVDAGDITVVAISRPARTISRDEMQDSLMRVAMERGASRDIAVVMDDHHAARLVDAHRTDGLKVATFARDARSGRFEARLVLPGASDLGESWTVTGSIVETREIAVPVGDLDRGEPIQMKDLMVIKRPAGQVTTDIVRPISDLVGMVPRRALRAGEPIRTGDIVKPLLVEKNQLVTVHYASKGLSLSMRGRAQNSGTIGETIKVQNPQSKRIVEGVASAPGQVTITSITPHPASLADANSPTRR